MSRLNCSVLLLALTAGICAAQMPIPDCSLAPGFTQDGELRTFDSGNLFEYMDGNSEGYFIYDFEVMKGVNCKSGEVTLVFDISQMSSPETALGMFMSNHDPRLPTETLGTIGQIHPRRGTFVKDKYYVEIAANPSGDHSKVLRTVLTATEKRISGTTEMPAILDWFPQEKLEKGTLRLVPQSLLGLRILRRGYLGVYDYGKGFIVTSEATPEDAAAVMKSAVERFGETTPVQLGDEAFEATDRYLGRLCFFRKGRYVGGFANVDESTDIVAAAKALASKIQ